jgi:hypothetical protein
MEEGKGKRSKPSNYSQTIRVRITDRQHQELEEVKRVMPTMTDSDIMREALTDYLKSTLYSIRQAGL